MSTPTTLRHARRNPLRAQRLSRLRVRHSPEARPALLGFLGAVLITVGGLGAGSTRLHDPLLESLHLSWLRFGHGLVLSSVLLWGGVAVMLIAWLWLGRRVIDGTATEYTMVATTGFWLAPLLLSVPVFSRDTYSYLAQGALLRDGFDPYAVGPIDNPNALLDNVSPIWTTTTAPYGPAFILVAKFVTMLVGNHVIAGTMLLRLCMLPGLVLLIWAAPRIARHVGAERRCRAVDLRAQPAGDHPSDGRRAQRDADGRPDGRRNRVDLRASPVAGIALIAVAVAVKATAGIALPFMVWVWMRQLRERRGYRPLRAFAAAAAASVLIFVAVFAVLSGVAGVGLGWLTALAGSVKIINWLTRADGGGQPDPRDRRIVLPGQLLRGAASHPHRRDRDHRDVTAVAVVAISARRPRSADRHRVGDAGRGVVRARRAALVLHLAAGGAGPARPVTPGGRGDRRVLDLDHGDLQTRWRTWHVLVAARPTGHRGGVVRVAHAEPARGGRPQPA